MRKGEETVHYRLVAGGLGLELEQSAQLSRSGEQGRLAYGPEESHGKFIMRHLGLLSNPHPGPSSSCLLLTE